MSESNVVECAVPRQLIPASNAVPGSGDQSLRLDLNQLLRHPRIEPIIRRMFPDQRRYERLILPNVVGYLGNTHASRPCQITDISIGGFCMVSDQHWTPGTEMPITLQREDWDGNESSVRVCVQAIVVRCGSRRVGFSIALSAEESIAFSAFPDSRSWINKQTMVHFLENLKQPSPPRLLPIAGPEERPLSLAERTERLLVLAGAHRLSPVSELWHSCR